MLFSKARPALRRAIRTVVESLEDRRLLAAATLGTPSSAGPGLYLPVTLTGSGAPTLTTANLSLQNLTAPDTAETHPVSVSTAGGVATFKLNRPIGGGVAVPLEDGWYDASVRHAALTPDEVAGSFGFLNADFDGDGGVSINDYNILAGNWGKTHHPDGSPMTFAEGDADYDGGVSINDFNILANRFGMTLPAAPTQAGGVAVGNTTAGMLDVIWNADPSQTRDGFKVYRSDNGGQTYTLIHTEADPAARTWQDTGPMTAQNGDPAHPLTLGQKYWYRVRSYTDANGANASVTRAWGIPTRPTAAVTDLYIAGIGPGRIALKWKAPADPSVKGYRIYRSTGPNFLPSPQTLITTVSSQKLAYIDSGLSRGHTYYYRVVAVGLENSVAMPSLPASAPAQNQGQGFSNASNGGVPFDPATHDSDGDGTVDLLDNDNDNDGTADEADDDDDNNGVPDNAEPDDRDTDGDGTADNADGDDDNDGMSDVNDSDDDNDQAEDEEDASTGDIDVVPSGPGTWTVFSTFSPYVANPSGNYGLTPHYVDMDYKAENTETDPVTGEVYNYGPKMGGFQNDGQSFTLSNIPKHSIIGVSALILGDGILTPQSPDDSGVIEMTFGGETVEAYGLAFGSLVGGLARFDKSIESTGKDVTVSLEGTGFDSQGSNWNISTLIVTVTLPKIWVSGGGTVDEENQTSTTVTVNRSGPTDKELDVDLDKMDADGLPTADAADFSTPLPTNVHFDPGESSKTITVTVKDDNVAEGKPPATTWPLGGKTYGPTLNEAVVFKVKKNDEKYVAGDETATVSVADASRWYDDRAWTVVDDVPHISDPEVYLGDKVGPVSSVWDEDTGSQMEMRVVDKYFATYSWRPLGVEAESQHFGDKIDVSYSVTRSSEYSVATELGLSLGEPIEISVGLTATQTTSTSTSANGQLLANSAEDTKWRATAFKKHVVIKMISVTQLRPYQSSNAWTNHGVPANPTTVKEGDIMGTYMQKTEKKLRRFVDEDTVGTNDWVPE